MDPSQQGHQPFVPHPLLPQPVLYVAGLPPHFTDADLAPIFEACVPYRPRLNKDGSGTGTIEFKSLLSAEKALTTLPNRPLPTLPPHTALALSPFPPAHTPPPHALPTPSATPRVVKHLPPPMSDADLFDLFRPFGPLAAVRRHTALAHDTALVEFWHEPDAARAEAAVHCAEVGGYNVAVQPFQPRRASGPPARGVDVHAPPFVPRQLAPPLGFPAPGPGLGPAGSGPHTPTSPYSTVFTSPRPSLGTFDPGPTAPGPGQPGVFAHGPGQQVQLAPLSGPGSSSTSGLIDPCNLFIKNLDFEVDSHGLFEAFKRFGRIVSARVMRNDAGASKGFGFVSFQTPEEAAHALQVMDSAFLGQKQIVVRLHEPKALRQEKLRERFGAGGGAGGGKRGGAGGVGGAGQRRSEGASPVMSEGTAGDGESGSGDGAALGLGQGQGRPRRGSGSYYAAALQGNIVLHYDELSSLSPVVRREVLFGELSRRLRELDAPAGSAGPTSARMGEDETEIVIEALVALPLDVIVEGLREKGALEALVRRVRGDGRAGNAAEQGTEQAGEHEQAGEKAHEAAEGAPEVEGIERANAPAHLDLPERPGPSPAQGVPLGLSASAPEHPSSPVSLPGGAHVPSKPLTPSPHALSTAAQRSERPADGEEAEREKLRGKVQELHLELGPAGEAGVDVDVDEIVGLLMTLSKKERALCAFSAEYLRTKVQGAWEVVMANNATQEEGARAARAEGGGAVREDPGAGTGGNGHEAKAPVPVRAAAASPELTRVLDDTHTPAPASAPAALPAPVPSRAHAPPTPSASPQPAHTYTLETLAQLPAASIMALLAQPNASGLPLPIASADVVRATDAWMDELERRTAGAGGAGENERKQKVGEKVHKVLKGFGMRNAAKVAVVLVDTEDARALAHLANEYPMVLREKVLPSGGK